MDDRYGLNLYGQLGYKGIAPDLDTPTDATRCFALMPDWVTPVGVTRGYRTVLSRTPYGLEQRRPQRDRPLRVQRTSFLLDADTIAVAGAFLDRMHADTFWCPLYCSMTRLLTSGALTGLTEVTPRRSISANYDWTHYASYAMLIDRNDPLNVEVLEIASVGATVTFVTPVTLVLVGADAVLAVAMRGYADAWDVRDVTDALSTLELTFREILLTEAA